MELLPAELKLQILPDLLSREIGQVRNVSHLFRELIDAPRNQTWLYTQSQARSVERLQQSVTAVLDYDPTEGIFKAFQRFLDHRGIAETSMERGMDIHGFLWHWEFRSHGGLSGAAIGIALLHVKGLLEHLVELHVRHHCPDIQQRNYVEAHEKKYMKRLFRASMPYLQASLPHHPRAHITVGDLNRLCKKIKAKPIGYFNKGLRKPLGKSAAKPKWVLGSLRPPFNRCKHGAELEIRKLSEVLGVPEIKFQGVENPERTIFAYCVETAWAYYLVKDAVEDGHILTPKNKARVLEQMSLY